MEYFHCSPKKTEIFPTNLSQSNAQVSQCFSQSTLPAHVNELSASLNTILEYNREEDDNDSKEMAQSIIHSLSYQLQLLKFDSNYKALEPSLTREEVKRFAEEVPGFLSVTPLIRAVKENDLTRVRLIAESGANLEGLNEGGNSALLIALLEKRDQAAKILISNHANPNTLSKYGLPPLVLAAARPNLELVKLMLSHHADPNIPDSKGRTPLMLAVMEDDSGVVELLLQNGADPTLKTDLKTDALALAKKSKNRFLLNQIQSAIQSWKESHSN
ncbi:MAG: ankyrin repeat domain-containing protein [Bdellovibrionia bacterium]